MAGQVKDLGELNIARLQEDEDVLLAAFADHPKRPVSYVILSRLACPSAEDIESGDGNPHIEIDGQENSQYDPNLEMTVDETKIRILFSHGSDLHSICPGIEFESKSPDLEAVLAFIEESIGVRIIRSQRAVASSSGS